MGDPSMRRDDNRWNDVPSLKEMASEPSLSPHSQSLRRHRQMEGPGTFFLTKCLFPKIKIEKKCRRLRLAGAAVLG